MPVPRRRCVKRACSAIGLLMALGASQTHAQPLPPVKPSRLDEGAEVGQPDAGACLARLDHLGVEYRTETGPFEGKACAIAMPIRLGGLVVRHGAGVSIQFPEWPLIDCRLAEPLALWVGGVIAPVLAGTFSSALKRVTTGPGFECRNRNYEPAGKVSAHAIGFALDISGFELANGRVLSFGSNGDPEAQAALQTVRTAACGWFTTVLRPGSDAAHENHLHVDIERHGTDQNYRICQ